MAETKNLCAQIDLALHTKVCEEREKTGLTTSQYITQLLTEYYEIKENGGKSDMANNGNRTMAFQIPEELFQRIKRYLERESDRLGRRMTQEDADSNEQGAEMEPAPQDKGDEMESFQKE